MIKEDKMKQTSKTLSVILSALFLIVVLSSFCLAADRQAMTTAPKDVKVVQKPVPDLDICKDPAVKNFNITKTLSNNVATFTMTGQVCNNGPGNYNQPDNFLEAHFNVYAGYGP